MRQDEFAGRVPDADKRREAERLWRAMRDAEDKRDAAAGRAADAHNLKFAELYREADQAHAKRLAEIDAVKLAESPVPELDAAVDAAEKAWQDYDCPGFDTDHNDELLRCALSGLPIFEGDIVLEDGETGEKVLKACLGVPLDEDDGSFLEEGARDEAAAA